LNNTVNSTEEFVFNVCQKTFLSLWCYANPVAEPGKELCDILIVCDPHVIIVSVKGIRLNREKEEAGYNRWLRKAVEDSVKQIYGAERSLATAPHVIRKDGTPGLALPALASQKTHRIAVAFGSGGEVPITSEDFGKGFVHVMNEESFFQLLMELDTITDLVEYLGAKEALLAKSSVVVEGPESNLLGWYLFRGRSFPQKHDIMFVDDTVWKGLCNNPEFQRRKQTDVDSYAWDELIEALADTSAKPVEGPPPTLNELDLALREMARETRFSRRVLGKNLREFLEKAKAKVLRSRMIIGDRGIIYVFVFFSADEPVNGRIAELAARSCAARQRTGRGEAVIGIGIGEFQAGIGSTSDVFYIKMDDWSNIENDATLRGFGYFTESPMQNVYEDEYPRKSGA
jgi:hypothetical protein